MAVCPMNVLLKEAGEDRRAAGAFNVGSMEMLMGVVQAAEETNTPVILQIAEKRLKHSPLCLMAPMMVNAAEKARVDIALQLDHGYTKSVLLEAVDWGFTSIMYDGSHLGLSENIARTREMVEWARRRRVNVEAEIGVLSGSEGGPELETVYTDPEEAAALYEQSGCDALAVAIGNAHGHYKGKPQLNFAILERIQALTDAPLVLHGGSGIPAEDFHRAISMGVRKINIATANMDALVSGARRYLEDTPDPNYFGLNESMTTEVAFAAKKHILTFRY